MKSLAEQEKNCIISSVQSIFLSCFVIIIFAFCEYMFWLFCSVLVCVLVALRRSKALEMLLLYTHTNKYYIVGLYDFNGFGFSSTSGMACAAFGFVYGLHVFSFAEIARAQYIHLNCEQDCRSIQQKKDVFEITYTERQIDLQRKSQQQKQYNDDEANDGE